MVTRKIASCTQGLEENAGIIARKHIQEDESDQ